MLTAIITGDIIQSREALDKGWLNNLKEVLNHYGEEPQQWQLFRGDSFQLQLNVNQAVYGALHIKATIKQIKNLDVRMAIGLGEITYLSNNITESNGSAFIYSGECFEALKKQTLAVRSSNIHFNQTFNVLTRLAMLTANDWSSTVSQVIKTVLEQPGLNQNEIASLLGKSQSSISEALKRGGFEEMMLFNQYYQNQIPKL